MDNDHDRKIENERKDMAGHDTDLDQDKATADPNEPMRSYEAHDSGETAGSIQTNESDPTVKPDGIGQPDDTLGMDVRKGRGDIDPYSWEAVHGYEGETSYKSEGNSRIDQGSLSSERAVGPGTSARGDIAGSSSNGPGVDQAPSGRDRIIQYDAGAEDRKSRRNGLLSTLAMVLIGAILGSAITLGSGRFIFGGNGSTVIQNPVGDSGRSDSDWTSSIVTAPPADVGTTPENLIAEHVTPSVVGITTQTRVNTAEAGPFFFGFQDSDSVVQGVGSGVIVTEDGYILTNSHVVSNGEAEKIQVIFSDGTSVEGEVLWNDSTLDLAIVKADATGLTPVEIGSSDLVRVGDKAIAIGNPLGMDLQSTLTSGYISGLERSISLPDGGVMSGIIQTDAAINKGNSGGALLNSAGQLIGINTAKAGGSASGIGFAIPIDTAKPIIEKVMTDGSFQSVYLGLAGVDAQTVRAMGEELDYDGDGVYIMEIMAGTAADEAGLKVHDIITGIDGKPFSGMTELKKILLSYEVGDTVEVTYVRENQEDTVELTFAQDSSNIDEYSTRPETTPTP